jgi:hypothetical protein
LYVDSSSFSDVVVFPDVINLYHEMKYGKMILSDEGYDEYEGSSFSGAAESDEVLSSDISPPGYAHYQR